MFPFGRCCGDSGYKDSDKGLLFCPLKGFASPRFVGIWQAISHGRHEDEVSDAEAVQHPTRSTGQDKAWAHIEKQRP